MPARSVALRVLACSATLAACAAPPTDEAESSGAAASNGGATPAIEEGLFQGESGNAVRIACWHVVSFPPSKPDAAPPERERHVGVRQRHSINNPNYSMVEATLAR